MAKWKCPASGTIIELADAETPNMLAQGLYTQVIEIVDTIPTFGPEPLPETVPQKRKYSAKVRTVHGNRT